ncbi:hypothetical protein BCR44DRAFT_48338 [Catenaria anguillulae PL171]|uniref:Ankyrin repeat-containing domain protein n=1 Tax=Catenaria anguillulae PL171 TaxID=765915 RepID=A0A1Y2HEE9_9FUNG|nr:hypothetical protein BCR44DRAFT_48338 [Catenaria anguillulae PL171]
MFAASKHGHTDVLDFWAAQAGMKWRYGPMAISACVDLACQYGQVHVIEWWSQRANVSMAGNSSAMQSVCQAIEGGHQQVVSWVIEDSGFRLDREAEAVLVIVAILTKQPDIADQLVHEHGFALTPVAASFACLTGSISTLTQCASLVSSSATSAKKIDGPVAYLLASAAGSIQLLDHLKDTLRLEPGLILAPQEDEFFSILRILIRLATFAHIQDALETWFNWSALELLPANVASLAGHAHVLIWLAEYHGSDLNYAQCAAIAAATHGHVSVLEWWVETHIDGIYRWPMSADLVDKACANGHLPIVQCLWEASKSSGWVRFEFSPRVVFPALAEHGRVDFAQWWIVHIGKPRDKELVRAVAQACKYGQLEFLKMMVDSQLLGSVDDIAQDAIGSAAKRGHVTLVEWWACQTQHRSICRSWLDPHAWPAAFDVIAWVLASGFQVVDLTRTETEWFVIEQGPHANGVLRAVHEAKTLYLDLCLSPAILGKQVALFDMSAASTAGQIAVLDWAVARAKQGKLRLDYSWDSVLRASQNRAYHVLDWWLTRSGLELAVSAEGLGQAVGNDEVMREWWRATGLVNEEELKWDAEQEQGWGW